ncbi:MAG: efflux transporter outer membrane subunit [Candidatus Acidiferrales bacterium]
MKLSSQVSLALLLSGLLVLGGCDLAPKYHAPVTQAPPAYKELTPADQKVTEGWRVAEPKDDALHGQWWSIFNDPQLNGLEDKVNISNQTIAVAFSNYMAARALVREARSQYSPTVTTNPSIINQRSGLGAGASTGGSVTDYSLPFDATWVPDLWGRVRNTVRAASSNAQASAADLENTRLAVQAELAVDYYELRGQDALKQLLDSTVVAYQQSLDLTKVLYQTGIASDEAVAEAETQLKTAEAEDTALGIMRAQYEHAIAMLVGEPASTFSLAAQPLESGPPGIPIGVPSQLLERRPDIAAAERQVAGANAQIGVARAAYYPNLTLSGGLGLQSASFTEWFTWPSRFWSVGPAVAETIFDAGLRRATVEQYRATYDATVANYRETVLTAFEQVEDNLSSLRILSQERIQQDDAVAAAQRTLVLATDRYKLGIDPYLNVITAQTALLGNQQAAVNVRTLQMTASVQLIEALGGGWDASQLPTAHQVISRSAPAAPATAAPPSPPPSNGSGQPQP